jgi:hypothetical protein
MGLGRPPCTLLHQGNRTFVAREDPNAIRLTFSVRGRRADKILIRMAAVHRHADRAG